MEYAPTDDRMLSATVLSSRFIHAPHGAGILSCLFADLERDRDALYGLLPHPALVTLSAVGLKISRTTTALQHAKEKGQR